MTRAPLLTLEELLLRITRLPERSLRRAQVRRWVLYAEPESVVAVLEELLERCRRADYDAQDVALAVADFLAWADDEDRLALEALDLAAVKQGHVGTALLLSAHPPHRQMDETARRNARLKRHVPLGMRRWKARGKDRAWLEVLLADLDPEVISTICANRKTRQEDVLQVVSKRPNTPEVLDAVARSRWLSRDVVRRGLIQNPYARTGLAISLLPMMSPLFLAALRYSGQVHEAVRQMASYLVGEAPQESGDSEEPD